MNIFKPKSGYIDKAPAQKENLPTGPFKLEGENYRCCLLIFVPRNAVSALINDTTGGYGYSHLAVDCGELDVPTGKRVMIESTFGHGVHTSFQDEYGERKFVRIPLEKTGIIPSGFSDCIHSKLGEKFDYKEALTIGLIHNPVKQICSDLATVCLPETMRTSIAHCHEVGFLHTLSTMRLPGNSNEAFHLFITPNGFAEYFGVPKGKDLDGPDQLSEPILSSA